MGSRTQLLDFADLLQRVSPDVSALVQMLDVDGFAAACAARLHLDSPSSVRAGQASTSDPGVAGVRNLDLSAIGLPQQLEQARLMEAGGWGAAVGINLEDERSESQPSDIDGVARQSSPQEDYDDVDLDELAAQQAEGKGQGVVKRAWTVEEDDSLLQLVREHGPRRWSVIASQLPDRVGKQCRERCPPPPPSPPAPHRHRGAGRPPALLLASAGRLRAGGTTTYAHRSTRRSGRRRKTN